MKKQISISIIVVVLIVFVMSCRIPPLPPIGNERIKLNDWICHESQFSQRSGHVSLLFSNYKYIIGGTANNTAGLNDVWKEFYNTIGNWVTATASAEFSPRWGHTGVVFGQKMWVIGGTPDGVNGLNDVWYSEDGAVWVTDGAEWVTATASAAFSGRWGHQSQSGIDYSINKYIFVIGGRSQGDYFNDVWSSENGKNWIKQNNTNLISRVGFSSIVSGSFLRVFGGYGGSDYYNDECSSYIDTEEYY
ncbi:MAG TPA: hypothetical protein ENN43_05180 [bacterium]|nr:hypothetical protein [bacterium]